MALPPKPLAGMIEGAMGPGGPDMAPDQMLAVEIEVQGQPELPLGIEMVGEEQMEVEVEEYNHNANLAEVLDDSILGTLSSDLMSKVEEDKESREEWEEAIAKGLT